METEKANKLKADKAIDPSQESEEIEIPYEGITDYNLGVENNLDSVTTTPDVSGGDIDVNQYQAEVEGDEAVGGTTPTPEQNVTEYIERSVGLEMDDQASLRTNDILEQRDDQRWELDPTSSEDYQERRD